MAATTRSARACDPTVRAGLRCRVPRGFSPGCRRDPPGRRAPAPTVARHGAGTRRPIVRSSAPSARRSAMPSSILPCASRSAPRACSTIDAKTSAESPVRWLSASTASARSSCPRAIATSMRIRAPCADHQGDVVGARRRSSTDCARLSARSRAHRARTRGRTASRWRSPHRPASRVAVRRRWPDRNRARRGVATGSDQRCQGRCEGHRVRGLIGHQAAAGKRALGDVRGQLGRPSGEVVVASDVGRAGGVRPGCRPVTTRSARSARPSASCRRGPRSPAARSSASTVSASSRLLSGTSASARSSTS